MGLMTIGNFAKKHKVKRQAIEYALDKKKIKATVISGKRFIDSKTKYKPRAKSAE